MTLRKTSIIQQKRLLYELQLSTRVTFLEKQIDAFAETILGLSAEQLSSPVTSWPAPPAILPQEAAAAMRLAGELQRLRALMIKHKFEAKMPFIRDLDANQARLAELHSMIASAQIRLTEIPLATTGLVGLWGERYFHPHEASLNWRHVSEIRRAAACKRKRMRKTISKSGESGTKPDMPDDTKNVTQTEIANLTINNV